MIYRRLAGAIVTAGAAALLLAAHGALASGGASPRVLGGVTTHVVARGETLRLVGARYAIDAAVIAAQNGVHTRDPLREGQVLRIESRHVVPAVARQPGLTINVPQRMLFLTEADATTGHAVAVGKADWRTPLGPFRVATKEENPTWDVPPSIMEEARRAGRRIPAHVPPGPSNPLGKYWLGLSVGGVGIHGTNAPSSIYQVTTHGCIRMHPDTIAWLFPRVPVGTVGHIIYEPILLAADAGEVFLEVHPDVYRRLRVAPRDHVRALAAAEGVTELINWAQADAVIAAREGIARPVRSRATP